MLFFPRTCPQLFLWTHTIPKRIFAFPKFYFWCVSLSHGSPCSPGDLLANDFVIVFLGLCSKILFQVLLKYFLIYQIMINNSADEMTQFLWILSLIMVILVLHHEINIIIVTKGFKACTEINSRYLPLTSYSESYFCFPQSETSFYSWINPDFSFLFIFYHDARSNH